MEASEVILRLCADIITRKTFNIRNLSELIVENPKRTKHLCLSALRTILPGLRLKKINIPFGEPMEAEEAAVALCGDGRVMEYPGWIDAGNGGIICHIKKGPATGKGMWDSFGFGEDCSFPLCSSGNCPAIGILRQLRTMNLAFGGLYIGVHLIIEGNDAGYYDPALLANVFSILAARSIGWLRLFKLGGKGTIIDKAMVVGGHMDRAAILPISDRSLVKSRCYRLDIVNGEVI